MSHVQTLLAAASLILLAACGGSETAPVTPEGSEAAPVTDSGA